jgi:hypothetical protein
LVSAWLYTPSRYQSSIRDLSGINNAAYTDTYSWQETDNELGSGIYTAGVAGYGNAGNDASIQVASTGLTLSVWVRLYQSLSGAGFPGLIGKGDSDSTTLGSYLFFLSAGPVLRFIIYSGSARVNNLTGATSLDFQSTYHLAATWNPSTRTSIFVNGIRDATTTTSVPATLDNPAYSLLLGTNQGGATLNKYGFRGLLFEARVYSRALSEDEIYQLYNPTTRWDLYRSPQRFLGLGIAGSRVQGPAGQIF